MWFLFFYFSKPEIHTSVFILKAIAVARFSLNVGSVPPDFFPEPGDVDIHIPFGYNHIVVPNAFQNFFPANVLIHVFHQ